METEIEISFYPNPTSGLITKSGLKVGTLEIFDAKGLLLLVSKISMESQDIDINHLPIGIYTFRYLSDDDVIVRKVIKQL